MIISADEARRRTIKNEDFDAICESVMRDIEDAVDEGRMKCFFYPTGDKNIGVCSPEMYDKVKEAFLEQGYSFEKKTIFGYETSTELICW